MKVDAEIQRLVEHEENFDDDVANIENQLIASTEQRQGKKPGEQLKYLLEKWNEEHIYSNQELKQYANELALSLKEFEKELAA